MPVAKKKHAPVRKTVKRATKVAKTHGPKFVSAVAAENVENGPSIEKGEDLCMTSRRFLNERKAALGGNDSEGDGDFDDADLGRLKVSRGDLTRP